MWREEGGPFPIRKPDGPAVLVIDDEGGLLRARPTIPETLRIDGRFGWEEVQKIERMPYLGIPFLGEAVRFTLKPGLMGSGSRTCCVFRSAEANFRERPTGEVRRIPLLRTRVNKEKAATQTGTIVESTIMGLPDTARTTKTGQ